MILSKRNFLITETSSFDFGVFLLMIDPSAKLLKTYGRFSISSIQDFNIFSVECVSTIVHMHGYGRRYIMGFSR